MLKKPFYSLLLASFSLSCSLWGAVALEKAPANLMQSEIKHVVVLMMENRSFDNVLAWLYDEQDVPNAFIPNTTDKKYQGLAGVDLSTFTNTLRNSAGEVIYTCAPIKGLPSLEGTPYLNSPKFNPNEAFSDVTDQIYGNGDQTPNMLGFLQDFAEEWDESLWISEKKEICAVLETYTEKELPILHSLAKHYAISDMWFSSVPTQTNPNRAFSLCGTSEGEVVNGLLAKNFFHADTLFNRLYEESPNTNWMFFWQGDMMPGIYKGPFSGPNTFASLFKIPNIDDHFQKIDSFHELARKGQLPEVTFLEPLWTICDNVTPRDCELDQYISRTDEFILGLQGNDLHPPGEVRSAENFLANIYTSLIANPEAWANTLLIITFDEHGGLFDHIVPPAAISPDEYAQNGFAFDRLGIRIPTILISPKIQPRTVIRSADEAVPFDHTSVIATIFKWKNVDQNQWKMGNRVQNAQTFENVITLTEARQDSILVDPNHSIVDTEEIDVLKMGDHFYLKDCRGNYLSYEHRGFDLFNLFHSHNKLTLEFGTGAGRVTHGSFSVIKGLDSNLGDANYLETSEAHDDCTFGANSHSPDQWWTIKSVDHPYLGAPIRYGDRIYLESQIYLDLIQYVPCRLVQNRGIFRTELATLSMVDEKAVGHYWTIERAP